MKARLLEFNLAAKRVDIVGKHAAEAARFQRPVQKAFFENAVIVLVMERENSVIADGRRFEYIRNRQILQALDDPLAQRRIALLLVRERARETGPRGLAPGRAADGETLLGVYALSSF